MAADLLSYDGWNVRFIGADLPQDALVELVARERPRFVGLSVALPERMACLRETIARLRVAAPVSKLVVGGRALACADVAGLEVDAAVRSASAAVELMSAWKR